MRLVVAAFGVVAALATITGCARQQKAQSSDELAQSMRAELSKTVDGVTPIEAMNDELAHTVGTTTLTNADWIISSPVVALAPMPLPESRMSLAEAEATGAPPSEPAPAVVDDDGAPLFLEASDPIPTQTWGSATQLDLTEIPDTRE